jgi:hypothetical protein
MPTPVDRAREHINRALEQAGWRVQDYKRANLHAGRGVVLTNFRPDIERKEIQHFYTYKQESMGNIRQENIRQIDFILRGFEEQRAIVAEVEHCLSVIDELEAGVEANLTRADRMRQSILTTAFSGRLAVSESEIARPQRILPLINNKDRRLYG